MSETRFVCRWWSAARVYLFAVVAALLIYSSPGLVWAAGKKPPVNEPPAPKGFTMMYMATIIVIAGGVAIVCLPSRRKKEVE